MGGCPVLEDVSEGQWRILAGMTRVNVLARGCPVRCEKGFPV